MSEESGKEVRFQVIDTTEDTGDPVIRVSYGGSHATVIIEKGAETINVWTIDSKEPGDMKTMLDEVVSQVKFDWVQFVAPFDDQMKEEADKLYEELGVPDEKKFSNDENDRNIRDVLDGFEEVTEHHRGQEIPLLVGFWEA